MPNQFWTEMETLSNHNEKAVNNELMTAYMNAQVEIQTRIATFMKDHPNLTYVQSMQLSQMKSLEKQIDAAIKKLFGITSNITQGANMKELEYGYFGEWYNIETQVGVQLSFGQLPEQKIKKLVESSAEGIPLSPQLYGAMLSETKKEIKEVLKQGLILGYDNKKMANVLSNSMGMSYRKAKTIIRTESGRVNSMARQEAQEEAAKHGVDLQKRWISTLDRKTRHSHAVLDGQIVGKDEEFETLDGSRAMQPRMFGIAGEDINCRCGCTSVVHGFVQNRRRDGETKKLLIVKDYDTWLNKNHPDDYAKFNETKKKILKDAKAKGIVPQSKLKAATKATAQPQQQAAPVPTQSELQASVAKTTIAMNKYKNDEFSGLWKYIVTPADYESLKKAGKFDLKKAYFEAEVNSPVASNAAKQKATSSLKSLDLLQKYGEDYTDLKNQLADIKKTLVDLYNEIEDDTYSQTRKDNAYWLKDRPTADNLLRPKSGEAWKSADSSMRTAAYDYTAGSGKFNRPLRGYNGSWSNFVGVGKVDLNNEGAAHEIFGLKQIISKSKYDFDIWVNRGVETDYGMESFLGLKQGDIRKLSENELKAKLLDGVVTDHAFVSTSPVKGAGFSGHKLNIYCPKGTEMLYAEPFSAYGNGMQKKWDGKSKQTSFGGEFEVILQKGYDYRITKLEKVNGRLYIDVDVVLPGK
jgi:SPP1 gp7 family putative phage head morphogenesis protein